MFNFLKNVKIKELTHKNNKCEWEGCLKYLEDPEKRNIICIKRILNIKLWNAYINHCSTLKNSNYEIQERILWHGTRGTDPKIIYQGVGFDLKYSKVGNCLWFAIHNTYSMNGFQHPIPNKKNNFKIFLAFVACGDI